MKKTVWMKVYDAHGRQLSKREARTITVHEFEGGMSVFARLFTFAMDTFMMAVVVIVIGAVVYGAAFGWDTLLIGLTNLVLGLLS